MGSLVGLVLVFLCAAYVSSAKSPCFSCFPENNRRIIELHKENGCRVADPAVPKSPDGPDVVGTDGRHRADDMVPVNVPLDVNSAMDRTRTWCTTVNKETYTEFTIVAPKTGQCKNKKAKNGGGPYDHVHFRMVTFLGFADDFAV